MTTQPTYSDYIEDAHQHLLGAKVAFLLAFGVAPDCFTDDKILKVVQVLNLIEIEIAHLRPQTN